MKSFTILAAWGAVLVCAGAAMGESILWNFNTKWNADVWPERAGDGSNNGTIVTTWNPGGWWDCTKIYDRWDGPGWFFRLGHLLDITDQTHFVIDLKGNFGTGYNSGFTFIPETADWDGQGHWGGWIWMRRDIPNTPEWTTYEIPMRQSDFSCWGGTWDGVMSRLDRLWMYYFPAGPGPVSFDNVGWVNRSGLLPGDANMDGEVGIADLVSLAGSYGRTHYAPWDEGDFNDDGTVGIADLAILADHYGDTAAAVPEPAALPLLASAAGMMFRRRR